MRNCIFLNVRHICRYSVLFERKANRMKRMPLYTLSVKSILIITNVKPIQNTSYANIAHVPRYIA